MITSNTSANSNDTLHETPKLIALLSNTFELIDASDSLYRFFGLDANQVKGQSWFKIFPDLSKDWRIRFEHTMYGVKDIKVIDKTILPDGTSKYFIWHLNPWKDSSGKQSGVVVKVKNQS